MGNLVDTGLGWYLDEDYLLTLGNVTLASVTSGGGPSQYDLPLYTGAYSSFTKDYGIKTHWAGSTWMYYDAKHTDVPVLWCYAWDARKTDGMIVIMSDYPATIYEATYDSGGGFAGRSAVALHAPSPGSGVEVAYYDTVWTGSYQYDPNRVIETPYNNFADMVNYVYRNYYGGGGSITSTLTKPQGGAGAFAIISYPHDGDTVYVGVGISTIGIPNSAATVAVDGVNGSYNTFNREGVQFTMFYTEQLTGELTANVPVVALDTDISALPGLYEARLFLTAADAAQIHVGFVPADEDPYAGGGTSQPGGGDGTFDDTSDQIDDSTTPTFSFAGSGFCRIYNPSLSELQDLANYLWTDTTFLQTIVNHAKQLLEDPIEAIISLAMLPVAIPQGTSETVKVLFINTRVIMAPATTQYVEVDCGTYTLEEYYGSALDYNPYTQVDLFLPFIGQVSLNTDEVMGHTIGVKYRVDIVSGLCVAKVFVDNDCMYQFSGNCAIFMPLNSADFSSYLSAAMTAATALVSAGAGMAAGAAAAGAEAVAEPAVQTGGNLLTSGESLVTPQMALQYRVEESIRPMYTPTEGPPSASLGEMERKFIKNSAAAVMGSKISFEHASHLAGNSGILGVRRPYLIINRPDMCNPEKYGKYNGRPCMMHLYLGNLTGYTEIQEIQLTGFSATNPELAEISKVLKGGVIF